MDTVRMEHLYLKSDFGNLQRSKVKREPITTVYYNDNEYLIRGNSSKDYIFERICHTHSFYDIQTLEKIRSLNLKGTYIDIGANIGNHSIYFVNECRAMSVIAIEANRNLIHILQANLFANNFLEKRIKISDCLIASYKKAFFVIEDETNNIGTSFSSPIAIEGKKFEIREGISLDDIMLELNEIKKSHS
ncbi:MAG: FkbM family methyltransferase [Brevefilum sp.]